MAGFWTQEREDVLLELWEERNNLYDVRSQAYSNRDSKSAAIRNIAEKLETTGEYLATVLYCTVL